MRKHILSLLILAFVYAPLLAAEKDRHFEVGASVGTPAVLNLAAGYWNIADLPLMVRFSGMYYGPDSSGIQADLGYLFPTTGSFKHYLALTATRIRFNFFTDNLWKAAGITYGINWHGLSASVSAIYSVQYSSLNLFGPGEETKEYRWLPLFQVGYSFFF